VENETAAPFNVQVVDVAGAACAAMKRKRPPAFLPEGEF
jgi:hypothetical protein